MKVSAQQLQLNTTLKTAQLEGYKGGARQLLRELAADLVQNDGTIRSGYLRISKNANEVNIKAGHLGSGATAATDLVRKLVVEAYGPQAETALNQYLTQRNSTKVGTLSFVKLIKAMEGDLSANRRNHLDLQLATARGFSDGRLDTTGLPSLKLQSEVADLLGVDIYQPGKLKRHESWQKGLEALYGEGNVRMLGNSGGEGVAYSVNAAGKQMIYKGFTEAVNVGRDGARAGDVGIAYSNQLLKSSRIVAPSEYVVGVGAFGSKPAAVFKVPASQIKDLAKDAQAGHMTSALSLYGVLMPKATGLSLDQLPGRIPDHQMRQITQGLYSGLAELNAHRVVHNDIKLHNVIFDNTTGDLKVIDLGTMKKLSKTGGPDGGPAMAKSAFGTPGYQIPWRRTKEFGPDADRYSFGVTLLAAIVKDEAVNSGDEAQSFDMLAIALSRFKRSADRPQELLQDVLSEIKGKDSKLHGRLQEHLESHPQFHDFLQKLFASSLPGENGDQIWSNLAEHPYLATLAIRNEVNATGHQDPADLQASSLKKLQFLQDTTSADFKKLNSIAASALVEAVYNDPELLVPGLTDAQREARFRPLENEWFERKIEAMRQDMLSPQSMYTPESLDFTIKGREILFQSDLAELQNPEIRGLLQRTLVQGKEQGLTFMQLSSLGRGENHQQYSNFTQASIEQLLVNVSGEQDLSREDIRAAKFWFL